MVGRAEGACTLLALLGPASVLGFIDLGWGVFCGEDKGPQSLLPIPFPPTPQQTFDQRR